MAIYSDKVPLLHYFEEVTRIPRHTGCEKAIGDYIVSCNEKRHHDLRTDDKGNILVYVEATEGYEDEPVIILQTHLDMIYEQDSDSDRDLTKEALGLILDGNALFADGSTLGAASAYGIASMLTVMNDESLPHPALQLLFTTGRYDDMKGARNFDASSLYGNRHILISLTGTNEYEFIVGGDADENGECHDWTYGFRTPVCTKAVCQHYAVTHVSSGIASAHSETEVDILKAGLEDVADSFGEAIDFDAMIMGPTIIDPDSPGESIHVSSMMFTFKVLEKLLAAKESEYEKLLEKNGEKMRVGDGIGSDPEKEVPDEIGIPDDLPGGDWLRLVYYFAPQDRRKVEDMSMHSYVRLFYEGFFDDRIVEIVKDTESGFACVIADTSKEEIDTWAAKLDPVIDLCEQSFYAVADYDVLPDEEDNVKRSVNEADKKLENCLNRINSLVGVSEFKKLCNRIASISRSGNSRYLSSYFERCAICFSINGGDGYSTLIDLFSELIKLSGIKEVIYFGAVTEVKKAASYDAMLRQLHMNISDFEPVSFDMTFKMEETETEEFRSFIRRLAQDRGDSLVFFKIPYSKSSEKQKMISALSSAFPLITIDVPSFSTEEYLEHARNVFGDFGFKVEPDAADIIEKFIVERRNRDHFYGLLSVAELVKDVIYQKSVNEAGREKEMSFLIRKQDLVAMEKKYAAVQGGVDTLDDMIGVDEIKACIDEIVVQLELAKEMPYEKRPGMHMIFTGGPGTGKTTVARILGQILKERGLLSKGQFYERAGRELCGKYIGETAPITNAICRDAYGSVLFIDEAYTLYRSADNERDFGREALDALVTQMENHRQDFIVIFAGYTDEMKLMLEANPGLKSRIPYEVKFRNFTREELADIYMNMVRGTYAYGEDLEPAVRAYFDSFKDDVLSDKSFSNARFVRNLFERTVSKTALRIQAQTGERIRGDMICIMAKDFETTVETEEFKSLLEKKQRTLGFV
ncbi:MAG: AAA family ATPase [Lachnospiraceae bacterium]|nr:AAA family ATPase [Lachnospiraceae bacterium]